MYQELPEKSMVQVSDCFRGYEEEYMTSYKDTRTQLCDEQVLWISLTSDSDDDPVSGNSFPVLNRMTL